MRPYGIYNRQIDTCIFALARITDVSLRLLAIIKCTYAKIKFILSLYIRYADPLLLYMYNRLPHVELGGGEFFLRKLRYKIR